MVRIVLKKWSELSIRWPELVRVVLVRVVFGQSCLVSLLSTWMNICHPRNPNNPVVILRFAILSSDSADRGRSNIRVTPPPLFFPIMFNTGKMEGNVSSKISSYTVNPITVYTIENKFVLELFTELFSVIY